jgi:DNA-binding MarR family transcriptional regulator
MPRRKATTEPADDFHTMPGYLVRRLQQISTAIFTEECASFDLTAVQYAALVAIGANPQVDATRLSDLISLDRSTLGDVLERIESKGWVSRSENPADRRGKLLLLTDEGRKVVVNVRQPVRTVQRKLLDPLSDAERGNLLSLLIKITEAHQEIPPTKG